MSGSPQQRWKPRTLGIVAIAALTGLALVAAEAASPGPSINSTSVGRAAGPYTPVPGATAPFYRTTPSSSAKFFRVRQ